MPLGDAAAIAREALDALPLVTRGPGRLAGATLTFHGAAAGAAGADAVVLEVCLESQIRASTYGSVMKCRVLSGAAGAGRRHLAAKSFRRDAVLARRALWGHRPRWEDDDGAALGAHTDECTLSELSLMAALSADPEAPDSLLRTYAVGADATYVFVVTDLLSRDYLDAIRVRRRLSEHEAVRAALARAGGGGGGRPLRFFSDAAARRRASYATC